MTLRASLGEFGERPLRLRKRQAPSISTGYRADRPASWSEQNEHGLRCRDPAANDEQEPRVEATMSKKSVPTSTNFLGALPRLESLLALLRPARVSFDSKLPRA
jgi:hypothetical protein